MEAPLVSGRKGNEGDGTPSIEAYTWHDKDNCKDTSGGAVFNFRHLRRKTKSFP